VILAGKEIRKLNSGQANSRLLAIFRRVLRESRVIARKRNHHACPTGLAAATNMATVPSVPGGPDLRSTGTEEGPK
jgi:hypothetical protein